MNTENFIVRERLQAVERFQQATRWERLSETGQAILEREVAELPSELPTEDFESRLFDLTVLKMQLARVTNDAQVFEPLRKKVVDIAMMLEEKTGILVVHKVRTNQPLTPTDLESLEQTLVRIGKDDGKALLSDLLAHSDSPSLVHFIRGLVGMDRSAAQAAFSRFLTDRGLTPPQIRFIELIIEQLTYRGMMEASALYEPPFSDLHSGGPEQLFAGRETVIDGIFSTLDSIRPQDLGRAG